LPRRKNVFAQFDEHQPINPYRGYPFMRLILTLSLAAAASLLSGCARQDWSAYNAQVQAYNARLAAAAQPKPAPTPTPSIEPAAARQPAPARAPEQEEVCWVTSEPAGARIEINDEYIGDAPLLIPHSYFHRGAKYITIIKAYPRAEGQYRQMKSFELYEGHLPKRIYFDMHLRAVPEDFNLNVKPSTEL
jgi:hypothetical protein